MKKFLLSLICLAFAGYASAQRIVPSQLPSPHKYGAEVSKVQVPYKKAHTLNKSFDDTVSGWFDYQAQLINNYPGFTYRNFVNPIFPDSTVKAIYGNGSGGTVASFIGSHSFGEVFDPKSYLFDADSIDTYDPKDGTFKWDSVAIGYTYYNYHPGSVDTLIIHYHLQSTLGSLIQPPKQRIVAYVPQIDFANSTSLLSSKTDTVLLTGKDTSSRTIFLRRFVGLPVPAKQIMAYTCTFRLGFAHKFGDTTERAGPTNVKVTNKVNYFSPLLVRADFKPTEDKSYNYGIVLYTEGKYKQFTPATSVFNTDYYPLNLGDPSTTAGNTQEYFYSQFHITSIYNKNLVAITEADKQNGYGVSAVYPNPSINGVSYVDMVLPRGEQVTAVVTNLMGQRVMTIAEGMKPQGQSRMAIPTTELSNGIYFYTLTAGSYTSTKKFTVVK